MYKQSVTYEDFDGNQVTEVLYFNLSSAEVTKLQINGTFERLQTLITANKGDDKTGLQVLEEFISLAYGERVQNGTRFHKDEQQSRDFLSSPAYDALFQSLLNGSETDLVNFIAGILPGAVRDQLVAQMAGGAAAVQAGVKVNVQVPPTAPATSVTNLQLPVQSAPVAPAVTDNTTANAQAAPTTPVPPAFAARNRLAEHQQRARQHGLRPQAVQGEVVDNTAVAAAAKPLSEMSDAELEAELAKRKAN